MDSIPVIRLMNSWRGGDDEENDGTEENAHHGRLRGCRNDKERVEPGLAGVDDVAAMMCR